MEEVKYLLRNFCDSRVRDVRIEIERDAIAVDKICIHSCIVPVIILLREISGKRNGCPRFFDINRCNLISHICNFSIRIIKFHNLRNEILKKFPVNIKMKIISQCARIPSFFRGKAGRGNGRILSAASHPAEDFRLGNHLPMKSDMENPGGTGGALTAFGLR